MCAWVDLDKTKAFLKKAKGQKIVTVYKYLRIIDGELSSPFYTKTKWKPGVIKSNSRAKLQTTHNKAIHKGIHVLLNKKTAMYHKDDDEVVVKLTAQVKDLICVGGSDAVFRNVTLSKAEYDKVMKCLYEQGFVC